jgi:prepilin-type N-terminal cleavage/methylation domain-containing protein
MHNYRKAFTIIEMIIVVGIIALLLSAVLYSKNLYQNNRVLLIVGEYQKYKAAFHDFYKIYNALPGDIDNAYDFFGSDCGPDTDISLSGCNGDGNGIIENYDEAFMANLHLSLAALIDGEYTGKSSSGSYQDHFVKSSYESGFYAPIISSSISDAEYRGRFDKFHYTVFGKIDSDQMPYDPILTSEQAKRLDSKIDDGVMWNGVVQIRYFNASSCNGSDLVLVGNYDLANTNIICNLLFYLDIN